MDGMYYNESVGSLIQNYFRKLRYHSQGGNAMRYTKPDYLERFYCTAENCPTPCAAPADICWTRTL